MSKFRNDFFILNFKEYKAEKPGEGIEIPNSELPGTGEMVDLQRCKNIGLKLTAEDEKKLESEAKKEEVKTPPQSQSNPKDKVKGNDGE